MAAFQCDIVKPEALLISHEASLVVVPGVEGEMGILKGHANLVSVLADGEARITLAETGEQKHFALCGGYVQVTAERVIVLANKAIAKEDIVVDEVSALKAALEEKLKGMEESEAQKTTLAEDLRWCEVQLKVAAA